jgi:hypothetical protein
MHDEKFEPEILCALCHQPLSLTTADTCSDEDGKPVHQECYTTCVTQRNPIKVPESPFVDRST